MFRTIVAGAIIILVLCVAAILLLGTASIVARKTTGRKPLDEELEDFTRSVWTLVVVVAFCYGVGKAGEMLVEALKAVGPQ
jgi:hypothetical protein